MDRGAVAKIGGMDRQTLRDWVNRFNAAGPDGLFHNWTDGPTPRLSADQLTELTAIVETGPDWKVDGVVRWRRADLKAGNRRAVRRRLSRAVCRQAFNKLGFSHMSARPRHPAQDERIVETFEKRARVGGPPVAVEPGCAIGEREEAAEKFLVEQTPKKTWPMGYCGLASGDTWT
jgi:transposase